MKNSIGIIVLILVFALAVTYLFLDGGEENIQRPTRISKRVKIDVPPPPISSPDETESSETESSDSFITEERKELFTEEPGNDTRPDVVIERKEEHTFQAAGKPVKEPVKSEEKKTSPQKQIIASKTPQMLVTPTPEVKSAKTLWVVNVVSVRSRDEANNFLDELKDAAYNAYLTEFDKDGTRWYRIRVGFFDEKKKAENAGEEISKKYHLNNYWVVKPSEEELSTYR